MDGVLTPAEAAAGQRYAEIVDRYERLVGFRSRHPSSVDYIGGSSPYDPYLRSDKEADDLVRRAKKHYDEARLLIPPYPSAAHRIIDEVCCNDREINPSYYPGLIDVLDKLAKAWRLDCLNRHDAEVELPASRILRGSSEMDTSQRLHQRARQPAGFSLAGLTSEIRQGSGLGASLRPRRA
jgi:hypothetical protein